MGNLTPEQFKIYYQKNKDKILATNKKYREANKEKLRVIAKQKREEKKLIKSEEDIELQKIMTHKRKIENFNRFANKDKKYQLAHSLRNRIRLAIRNNGTTKSKKSLELLGADIETVRAHLESQFKPNMTWENRGEWHVDHIIPCASFDLSKLEDQKKCFHYTNLQPLWAEENIKKGCKTTYI